MKQTNMRLAAVAAILALPLVVVGEETDKSIKLASNTVASTEAPVENIIVTGEKSEADLRREYWESEDFFYSVYNELNDERIYEVRCAKEAPTGSRIKQQVCRPEFINEAINRGDITRMANAANNPMVASKMKKFSEKVGSYMATSAELQEAAAAYGAARSRYVAAMED